MARKGTKTKTLVVDGHRLYGYGATDEEAVRDLERKRVMVEHNIVVSKNRTTVEHWARKWLEDYKKGAVGDAWFRNTEGILNNHILPEIGDMPIKDVTPSDIKRLMNRKSHFSESHQRKIAQILLQIFDSAEENGIIVKVPIRKIKVSVRGDKTASRTITDEERSLTLRTADKYPSEGLFFLIMLYCGLRPQEVSRLMMKDYDKDAKTLQVRRARKADGTTDAPKTQSGNRTVPVPSYLAERLNKLDRKPSDLIVTSQQGKPLTKTSQKRLWHKFRRHMDIENGAEVFRNHVVETTLAEDLRPYCYRHTYCTDLQDAGVPLTVAQRLMGHSDIKVTAQIYTHHSQRSFEDARKRIEVFHSNK